MGMEALETVVGYWEDALNAYQSSQNSKQKLLTTSEEAEFTKMLENILESAYQLQVNPSYYVLIQYTMEESSMVDKWFGFQKSSKIGLKVSENWTFVQFIFFQSLNCAVVSNQTNICSFEQNLQIFCKSLW